MAEQASQTFSGLDHDHDMTASLTGKQMINNDIIDSFSWGLSHLGLLLVLAPTTGVELGQSLGGNTLQHFLGENSQQLPANIERLKYRSVLVVALLVKTKRGSR